MTTLATRNNMEKAAKKNTYGVVALDLATGDEWSASAGDYFFLDEDQALKGEDGPLVLAVKRCHFVDALTEEKL